jgi:hypothetical protein
VVTRGHVVAARHNGRPLLAVLGSVALVCPSLPWCASSVSTPCSLLDTSARGGWVLLTPGSECGLAAPTGERLAFPCWPPRVWCRLSRGAVSTQPEILQEREGRQPVMSALRLGVQ